MSETFTDIRRNTVSLYLTHLFHLTAKLTKSRLLQLEQKDTLLKYKDFRTQFPAKSLKCLTATTCSMNISSSKLWIFQALAFLIKQTFIAF